MERKKAKARKERGKDPILSFKIVWITKAILGNNFCSLHLNCTRPDAGMKPIPDNFYLAVILRRISASRLHKA
jgi:hypothetical protein